jgi:hypothetical protein
MTPPVSAPRLVAAVAASVAFVLALSAGPIVAEDLRALWYAAEFIARGDPANVYAVYDGSFTMRPPEAWSDLQAARGEAGALYPYLYPPLWAVLAAPLTTLTSFQTFAAVAAVLNALLLVGCGLLGWRIAARALPPGAWVLATTIATTVSTVGAVALVQMQPQILVSFLILLAIERSRSGAQLQAGAALALAAAIKLSPALLVLLWVVTGRWRSVAAFTATGLGLAALSVGLAGWPMHEALLAQLSAIYGNVLVTTHSLGIPPLVAQLFDPDGLAWVEGAGSPGTANYWLSLELHAPWSQIVRLAPFVAVAAAAAIVARLSADQRERLGWPLAVGLLLLSGPLTWTYSYITLYAFLPILLERFGKALGTVLLLMLLLPVNVDVVPSLKTLGPFPAPPQVYGTLSMIALTAIFALMAWQAVRVRQRPPRTEIRHAMP